MAIDLREALNAISDVVANRPPPLREFDQIYMKTADMLLQAEHLSKWLDGKDTIFIGDGDAIGLSLMHLHSKNIISKGPKSIKVLDFDERIVNSINGFAESYGLTDIISAELYNVADKLPEKFWRKFDAFYTNPPYGGSNKGSSVEVFINRGIEAAAPQSVACIVVADYPLLEWPRRVLKKTQVMLLRKKFIIVEMLPQFHHYHLDDTPDLTSCSLIANRDGCESLAYSSENLGKDLLANFYGEEAPLKIRYIRDKRQGGRLPSQDHWMDPI